MSYDRAKYDALRSAKVPHKMALALAKDDLPNIGADPIHVEGELIEHTDETASAKENADKINEIIDRLNEVIGARNQA